MRSKVVFAERLRAMMAQRNISQMELAEMVGVSQATISFWIRGVKEPRLGKMDKLCEALKCTREDLMGAATNEDFLVALTNDEYVLLEAFEKADDNTKQIIRLALSAYMNKGGGE